MATNISVTVRYFALVKEHVDQEREAVELPSPATVGDLWDELERLHPGLGGLRRQVRMAVDYEFVYDDFQLSGGEEVALVPPIAGGAPAPVLTHDPIELDAIVDRVRADSVGGTCVFIGTVRDHTGDHDVDHLVYEAYEEMAEKKFADLLDEIETKWPTVSIAVQHRIGRLSIGDSAVVIAAASAHRDDR